MNLYCIINKCNQKDIFTNVRNRRSFYFLDSKLPKMITTFFFVKKINPFGYTKSTNFECKYVTSKNAIDIRTNILPMKIIFLHFNPFLCTQKKKTKFPLIIDKIKQFFFLSLKTHWTWMSSLPFD